MFQRIHRAALAARRPDLRLPPEWSLFHTGNRLAFFAGPRAEGAIRWVAETGPEGTRDIVFWLLTTPESEVQLAQYHPPYERYQALTGRWKSVVADLKTRFERIPEQTPTAALQESVDLEAATFGPVTQYRTYSAWLEHLTDKQKEFVERPADTPVRLRGPAGSGKTLTLEIKALRELYAALDSGQSLRILFATHSWAMADQVDSALQRLDERGAASRIDVYPLLQIARDKLPAERSTAAFALLGEDSLSGKRLQLDRIDEIVERVARGDWLAYRGGVSPEFASRVESPRRSAERNALVWDLMLEFATVLSAQGILPGINAERRYLPLQRTSWMMPLSTDVEKRFVLQVYTAYVAALKDEGFLTSDQLINDFLNYLETFTWNLQRERDGYDLIFVDELHLFNEQERLVLNYLSRSAAHYPKIFMALDPRQSPSEAYADFPVAVTSRGESGKADELLGKVTSLTLPTIHRFSPEILRLVQHIHLLYPTVVDMGADWEFDAGTVDTAAASGQRPLLFQHASVAAEVESVLTRADDLARDAPQGQRIAVALLDPVALADFERSLDARPQRVALVRGGDDVSGLRYSRRSVALGPVEYLAGLQFWGVIVGGLPNTPGLANAGYQRRRFLSLLYLAVSRASRYVEIHVNDETGGVPRVLESAVEAGILDAR